MQTDTSNDATGPWRAWMWTGAGFEAANGLPLTDRGFRYGMSVFESFPVRDGVGIFLEQHLARLRKACDVTGIAVPFGAIPACAGVLKEAGDGFGRVYVTAGDGGVTADCDGCRVLVMVERREETPGRVYHRGYDLGLHAAGHLPVFGGVKTGNYWSNLRAFREGVAARCNETLLFTPAGHLISACMANVFVVTQGRARTPDLSTAPGRSNAGVGDATAGSRGNAHDASRSGRRGRAVFDEQLARHHARRLRGRPDVEGEESGRAVDGGVS